MASELKVDKFTGVTTAGSIDVVGEGNSTTTNLQQGLTKAWTSLDTGGTLSTNDSFNQSSATDNGTGDHTTTHTNPFSGRKGSPCFGHTSNVVNTSTNISGTARAGTMISQHQGLTQATDSYTFQVYYGSSSGSDGNFTDLDAVWVARLGDLA